MRRLSERPMLRRDATRLYRRPGSQWNAGAAPGRSVYGMGDFGRNTAEGAHIGSPRPRLVCIPSSDRGFEALAQHRLDEIRDPSEFERLLRSVYPNVRVRQRELTGELVETWYVYRDGIFTRP
jgi:hypothetical protein